MATRNPKLLFISAILSSIVVGLFLASLNAIIFWLIWTHFGIGAKFAYGLPAVYLTPSLLECIGLFAIITILAGLMPKFK